MLKEINRIIKTLDKKAKSSFSDFSDYIDNLQQKGEITMLNNAVSRKFGYDMHSFPELTLADFKKVIYNAFKNNGRIDVKIIKSRGGL